MDVPRILAINDVRLLAPPETRAELDTFYLERLGFQPTPSPEQDLLIYRGFPRSGPRLLVRLLKSPASEPNRRHASIQVGSLAGLIQEFTELRVEYEVMQGMWYFDRRIGVLDPGGNRLELVESHLF